jgi:hypothetical protein
MNEFPLKNLYTSYFMDNDVGLGNPDPQGALDDLLGYDRELDLGYTYDADGYEPGWTTPAGYVGSVLLQTPGDIRMTGFQNLPPGDSAHEDGRDDLKYAALSETTFVRWEMPDDVRQLSCSGPYPELKPDEEV